MTKTSPLVGLLELLFGCMILSAQPRAPLARIERLFVEQFPAKNGLGKVRNELVVRLQRLNAFTIVTDRSKADATLSGDGEIWVKGYASLNPRSGRSPRDGTPVYGGYLSVELKDAKNNTLWSYLAAPESASSEIAKALASQVGKHLADVLPARH